MNLKPIINIILAALTKAIEAWTKKKLEEMQNKRSIKKNFFKDFWQWLFKKETPIKTDSTKKAVVIGIADYPSWQNDLQGPKTDCKEWNNLLKKNGYKTQLLQDNKATINGVKSILASVIETCKDGDKLIIVYSGHGSTVPDISGDESDSIDETWFLYDGNFLDDDLKEILSRLNTGCLVEIFSDSCFAGTITRSVKHKKIKRVGKPHKDIEAREILFAGSSENESGYEGMIDGKPRGAFSFYAIKILNENPEITVAEFEKEMKKHLPCSEFPQHPIVDCLPDMLKNNVI